MVTSGPAAGVGDHIERPHGLIGIVAGDDEFAAFRLTTGLVPDHDAQARAGYEGGRERIIEAAARASGGLVCGVGHSEVMLGQARRRNAEAIRVGRVDLRLGTAERLPSFDAAFDKVLAVNSMGFWFSEALDHPRGSPPARFTGTPAD